MFTIPILQVQHGLDWAHASKWTHRYLLMPYGITRRWWVNWFLLFRPTESDSPDAGSLHAIASQSEALEASPPEPSTSGTQTKTTKGRGLKRKKHCKSICPKMDSCFADVFYVWLIEPSKAIWWHLKSLPSLVHKIDGLVQDCSNSSALVVELLHSCTKPSKLSVACF